MGDPDSAYSFESSALIHGSPFFSAKKMDEPDEETLVKSGRIGQELIFNSVLHLLIFAASFRPDYRARHGRENGSQRN